MSHEHERVTCRRAIEALRSGVPNRDAVKHLGSSHVNVEAAFLDLLQRVKPEAQQRRQVPGILIGAGFGAGKSHLLEYLKELALQSDFVCSHVVISKETALFDPLRVFRAAVEAAMVPHHRGQAVHEIALSLKSSPEHEDLVLWANSADSGLAPVFPASLMVHDRIGAGYPDTEESIRNFWSGDPPRLAIIKDGLKRIRQGTTYAVKTVPVKELAVQRIVFVSRLILAAGFKGWVILLDEVELVGSYGRVGRARSYAELGRWLGRTDGSAIPGVLAVASLVDDFVQRVIVERGDRDLVGPKMTAKGKPEDLVVASLAEAVMAILGKEMMILEPPSTDVLQESYQRLKVLHGKAYEWQPPDVPWPEPALTRRMRTYVRSWICEWDLARLYPGQTRHLLTREATQSMKEDADLEKPLENTGDQGDESWGG